MSKYLISLDQSTQGTKLILFDENCQIVYKKAKNHQQIINDEGWVSHDLEEIYQNILDLVNELVKSRKISLSEISGVAISDQRETVAAWSKDTGSSLAPAIVWQDARAEELCTKLKEKGYAQKVKQKTGLQLSPYFSAAKFSWLLKNVPAVQQASDTHDLCLGTIDSWLLYRLTSGAAFKTEPSNASRTQLLNIQDIQWDPELCQIFGVSLDSLPEITDSNSLFGYTDFSGILPTKLPIRCMMGDSQAALYGHGCRNSGEVKATIGTGSSVMMNIGSDLFQTDEVVTSIGWQLDNKVTYVAEGNINYAGAVINWLIDDIKLLSSPKKAEECALSAKSIDKTYLVPAFSGLGAPYWKPNATAALTGMTRATGRNEIIKACLDSIGFQINDILRLIENQTGFKPKELNVDGGVTANRYLMQFISNLSDLEVKVPEIAEFSALGVALCAGQTLGIYEEQNTDHLTSFRSYFNEMTESQRKAITTGWERAVQCV